ncbi:MarR family winged helix-turn-helix transcriptional regulator [Actinosynnema sp. NPDC020468]|uniref:MarR family winged helix-turn-helix transcriptional regulator n=1 Tax=Actinosynnema sp. NPDC020468 TaxID=3154488 RepID=UPI0033EB64C1
MESSPDLTLLFTALSAACDTEVRERMARAGHPDVRTVHGYVFQHLLVGPARITDLADLLGMTAQGASKVVAEMERVGYAKRTTDPQDSRVRQVSLTEHGRDAVEAGRAARAEVTRNLLAHLEDGGDALVGGLDLLAHRTGALTALLARRLRPHPPVG